MTHNLNEQTDEFRNDLTEVMEGRSVLNTGRIRKIWGGESDFCGEVGGGRGTN